MSELWTKLSERRRQREIGQIRHPAVLSQENIARVDITVHDSVLMHGPDNSRQLEHEAHHPRRVEWGRDPRQGLCVDILEEDRSRVRLLREQLHDAINIRQLTKDRGLLADPRLSAIIGMRGSDGATPGVIAASAAASSSRRPSKQDISSDSLSR
jgi:hypothetical protein